MYLLSTLLRQGALAFAIPSAIISPKAHGSLYPSSTKYLEGRDVDQGRRCWLTSA